MTVTGTGDFKREQHMWGRRMRQRSISHRVVLSALLVAGLASRAAAQEPKPSLEVYGFGQADAIADFNQVNPQWFDVMRPSKLPKVDDEFGKDGHFYLSARQSRFGVRAATPTSNGVVSGTFEFDMFGVGADAGQTTIRLRHAYGQWKSIGAGQTNSQFMDGNVFPNTLDYWGPNGMLFFRNVQVFWQPLNSSSKQFTVSIENPGASGDGGLIADRVELQGATARFPMPDFAANFKWSGEKGYIRTSGMIRKLNFDDNVADQFDLSDSVTGWGWTISSNLKAGSNDTLRLMFVVGAGIQNYFNDAPVDVALKTNPGNLRTPVVGEALGITGLVVYLDHNWSSRYSTAVGYSRVDVDNSNLQAPNAYKNGQYASLNLLATPAQNVLYGGELQWTDRENFSDGFSSSDFRIQFSFKYSFSWKLGGE
jgi:hypothetical protein